MDARAYPYLRGLRLEVAGAGIVSRTLV